MKIDVDRLAAIIRTNLNADTRDGPACREIIALARVGAAGVKLREIRNRKPHYDRPLSERVKHDGEDLRAYHEWSDATDHYIATRPEGAQQ